MPASTMRLRVMLSSGESELRLSGIADLLKRKGELETEKRDTSKRLSREIKTIDANIEAKRQEVDQGWALQEVEVFEEERGAFIATIRRDTGEQVSKRRATPAEKSARQRNRSRDPWRELNKKAKESDG